MKFSRKIKALIVCAAMLVTAIVTPIAINTKASAATVSVSSTPFDFSSTATGSNTFTQIISNYVSSGAKKISFTIEASQATSFSYGFGISVSMDNYWRELNNDGSWVDTKTEGDDAVSGTETKLSEGSNTITIDLSSLTLDYQSQYGEHFEFRNYYITSGTMLSITNVEVNSNSSVTTTETTESNPAAADGTTELSDTVLTDDTSSDPATNVFLGYTGDYATSGIKTITFYCSTEKVIESFVYGFGIGVTDDPYWYEYGNYDMSTNKGEWVDTSDGATVESTTVRPTTTEFSITFDVSSLDLKYDSKDSEYPGKFEFRNYYSVGNDITITKIVINSSDTSNSLLPTVNSEGSGFTQTLIDSTITYDIENNEATITNTVTRKLTSPTLSDGSAAIILTPGYDEESYYENNMSTYQEGDPINSHKFSFGNFGVSGDKTAGAIQIEALSVTLSTTDNETCSRLMYGGGISVVKGSVADTEYPKQVVGLENKSNASYWYNDCGSTELEEYLEVLAEYKEIMGDSAVDVITPLQGYDITDESVLGDNFTVTWEIPEEVKPYVTTSGQISFQYWYGENGDEELGELEIEDAYLTYTETKTIPYTGQVTKEINKEIESGDSFEISYEELGIESYQNVCAAIFNIDVSGSLVYDFGTTTTLETSNYYYTTSTGESTGSIYNSNYYLSGESGNYNVVWIMPSCLLGYSENLDTNYVNSSGKIDFYNWYSNNNIKLNSITILERDSLDFNLEGDLELEVGETYQLEPTVEVASYSVKNSSVCEVSDSGLITAIGEGKTTITAISKYGEEVEITITVTAATTELSVSLWGDVNTDEVVSMSDVVIMCKYCVGTADLSEQGKLNANCQFDSELNVNDALIILGLNVLKYTQEDMPI